LKASGPLVPRTEKTVEKPGKDKETEKTGKAVIQASNEWEMTREERRRIRRERQRKEMIIGKKENEKCIKSGLKNVNIFVSRVHEDESADSMKEFICDEGVHVIDIKQVSSDSAPMKSFKVTIAFTDMEIVMTDTFWPKGIGCRRFYEKRS
jgi:hypothetical protein